MADPADIYLNPIFFNNIQRVTQRDLLNEGIIYFNSGRYFEAHEVWEDLWRVTEGPMRSFYQGLIHAAVGLYHLQRKNHTGASSQIGKSIRQLSKFTGETLPVDSPALILQLSELPDRRRPEAVRIVRIN